MTKHYFGSKEPLRPPVGNVALVSVNGRLMIDLTRQTITIRT